ncbi:unnamed protein product [Amoebophrya sp. A25]|nr:unnamed protein product [Amoebophrya sp. A25]|eukprot:GSA25T00009335001.1
MSTSKTQAEKDELLMQFLGMTEERVDPEVASQLLESNEWDLQRAVAILFDGGGVSPASGTGATGMTQFDAEAAAALDADDPMTGGGGAFSTSLFGGAPDAPSAIGRAAPTSGAGGPPGAGPVIIEEDDEDFRRALEESARAAGNPVPATSTTSSSITITSSSTGAGGLDQTTMISSTTTSGDSYIPNASTSLFGGPTLQPLSAGQLGLSSGTSSSSTRRATADVGGGASNSGTSGASTSNADAGPTSFAQSFFSSAPGGGASASGGAEGATQEDADAMMARALQESLNTGGAVHQSEDEQLRRAMALSANEKESLERQLLKEEQDAALAESALMDQMREAQEKSLREEQERERRNAAEAAAKVELEKEKLEARVRGLAAALPPEPEAGNPDRLALMFRLPNGKSVKRAFSKNDKVSHLYDFIDSVLLDAGERETINDYKLTSTFPRMTIDQSDLLLSTTKLENQTALMLQRNS